MKINEKKHISYVAAGIVIVAICLALVIVLKPQSKNITGSLVYVKYYGISDYPLAGESGKIQTYVKLTQPMLKRLEGDTSAKAIEISNNILETADFANGLVSMYKNTMPVEKLPIGALGVVAESADTLAKTFRSNIKCMDRIGDRHGDADEFAFVIVTEMVYDKCRDYSDEYYMEGLLAAKVIHNYYTVEGKHICREDSYPIFRIDEKIGEISLDTYGCY